MTTDNPHENRIALETLERYSGSPAEEFCPYLLLTNFPYYVHKFAGHFKVERRKGSMFTCAHVPDIGISIIDFRLGSPSAALTVDLCSFIPQLKAALMLGMCGGLRRHYKVGEYFLPLAAIRGEGTSDFYFPPEVPAMANFLIQKAATEVFVNTQTPYHIGICHTTNIRFWEFNETFIAKLKETKAQAIEMECAALFAASYRRKLPLGAVLLISDLPLEREGIKTKESSKRIFETYTEDHIAKGCAVLQAVKVMLQAKEKGAFRGKSITPDI